ncbi:ATP-binding cassette domain-containing protein [Polynucleobacter sp. AP-Jannik-300A-C4]|uniref:ATP-binding cassette domain-containing protein n=1 Tax=Polynucleobacter sp. AP-Jannik-300A-C4 TaxID=2576928 RepID=UPI00352F9464
MYDSRGGQRQRIGIARALYKKAKVIIFDEATSSLDMKTELAIVESIEALNPDITVLIIAHRTSTLRNCSRIIELSNGVIARVGQYQDMINS